MWVLILFFINAGNPTTLAHDFADEAACKTALDTALNSKDLRSDFARVRGFCTPKSSNSPN